jgi:hypothetical protein
MRWRRRGRSMKWYTESPVRWRRCRCTQGEDAQLPKLLEQVGQSVGGYVGCSDPAGISDLGSDSPTCPDEADELGLDLKIGKGKREIGAEIVGKKLDPPAKLRIHGSNPTKSHQTHKSQKNLGLFLWGFSKLGKKNTQIEGRKWRGWTPNCESTWL